MMLLLVRLGIFICCVQYFTLGIERVAYSEDTIENEFATLKRSEDTLIFKPKNDDRLCSAAIKLPGRLHDAEVNITTNEAWGSGKHWKIRHGNQLSVVTLFDECPFVFVETNISNADETVTTIDQLHTLRIHLDLNENVEVLNTLGTHGLRSAAKEAHSYAYCAVVEPESRNGFITGWLTQDHGVGLLHAQDVSTGVELNATLDFGHISVGPGKTRKADTLVLGYFEDARKGLEDYASAIARNYDIQLPPQPNVYCTWYHKTIHGSGSSTHEMLAQNARYAKDQLKPFGLGVMQIDDQWQTDHSVEIPHGAPKGVRHGPFKLFKLARSDHFPKGMEAIASELSEQGFTPGIWFTPFSGTYGNPNFTEELFVRSKETGKPIAGDTWSGSCIDITHPSGEEFLRQRFRRLHNWGYRYFKLDGLHSGTPSRNIYQTREFKGETFVPDAQLHNPELTFIEAYRRGLSIVREEAPDTFLLGCCAVQNMVCFAPAFGKLDAMRVGPDNGGAANGSWGSVLKAPKFAGNYWFLHRRVWYNDPDPFYVRESAPLSHVQCMASFLAVSGMMNTTSMQYAELPAERLDVIKRTLPSHELFVRPVDVLERDTPAWWVVRNDELTIVGAFNWNQRDKVVLEETLENIGLDSSGNYEVYDYWANKYLGTVRRKVKSELLPTHCQVLALRKSKEYPQVISTSRHITQGLMDLQRQSWNADTFELTGESIVVGGDPYELRIVCPEGLDLYAAEAGNGEATVVNASQDDRLVRVTISSPSTSELKWTVKFTK
ncbi:alpha-galactosidase [Bremerella sp. P1]|uniref:alpha-galactosidase n=1 Tax=Bremerella sp. P1 TaxID=3026424 RepID=UPI002368C34F|nr:hypothetical protein [Bremerella sp. P1]WDI43766.1 hypothetical protein PSR63_07375 [Bremerella sp. P1]